MPGKNPKKTNRSDCKTEGTTGRYNKRNDKDDDDKNNENKRTYYNSSNRGHRSQGGNDNRNEGAGHYKRKSTGQNQNNTGKE